MYSTIAEYITKPIDYYYYIIKYIKLQNHKKITFIMQRLNWS